VGILVDCLTDAEWGPHHLLLVIDVGSAAMQGGHGSARCRGDSLVFLCLWSGQHCWNELLRG